MKDFFAKFSFQGTVLAALCAALVFFPNSYPLALALVGVFVAKVYELQVRNRYVIERTKSVEISALESEIESQKRSLIRIQDRIDKDFSTIEKQAEETKKLLSTASVNHAFGATRRSRATQEIV